VFSSDNSPILDDGYAYKAVELLGNHEPGRLFGGNKYSAYDAGTSRPIMIYWQVRINKL
jgi:arylsulfatase A